MSEERGKPRYYGMFRHVDSEAGYGIWLPAGWHRIDMINGHNGVIYTPNAGNYDTSFSAEKRMLEYSVRQKDVPILRQGFKAGLEALPGIEVESQEETITSTLIVLEAKFSFLEGDARRKRWVRIIYWGKGQLTLIAQGATPEEYEYWQPMFYNTMMTAQVL